MAQYTYRCCSCGHEFDVIMQPKFRDAWQICPKCKGDSTRKKISVGTSFDLRGAGFYHQGIPKK